jgi:deoxyribose-phosphate aldolase
MTESIARNIDHTLLKPEASRAQIEELCSQALVCKFASVCVNPAYVPLCADKLRSSDDVKVCTVIGFPLGASATATKVAETQQALADGATEVDMVINVGAIKSNDWKKVEEDVRAVVEAAHSGDGYGAAVLCKVILETCLLTDEEKVKACQVCQAAGADFVKTSTGFSKGGATVADVALMRRTVGPSMGVKASGGIRCLADAQKMIAAGATRIGASAGVHILQESKEGAALVDVQKKANASDY